MLHRLRPLSAVAAALAALAALPAAQNYDLPGPLAVGWRVEVLPFEAATTTVTNRIYYPATAGVQDAPTDVSSGPYPIVGLIHGAGIGPAFYDVLSSHLASYGYVVASVGPMDSIDESFGNLSRETKELIDWLLLQGADPLSPYVGLVLPDGFGVIGSSKGGGASELFVGIEPRVRAAALLEPRFLTSAGALANLAAWDGSWLFAAGELDTTCPPGEVRTLRNNATGAKRRTYVEVLGAGHTGALDPDVSGLPNDPLPHLEQLRLHSRFVAAFFEAELRGREDAYHQIVGGGAALEPVVHQSTSAHAPLWAIETGPAPGMLALGLGGAPNGIAVFALAGASAAIPTRFGLLGLDPASLQIVARATLGSTGTHEALLAVPSGYSGVTMHVQGLLLGAGGVLTRSDAVVLP
jgi:dienelactone hydrolase